MNTEILYLQKEEKKLGEILVLFPSIVLGGILLYLYSLGIIVYLYNRIVLYNLGHLIYTLARLTGGVPKIFYGWNPNIIVT